MDGSPCGIEVTELVDPKILKTKSYEVDHGIHGHLVRRWTSCDFRDEVDALIRRKADKIKGWADDSRYSGRLLVIHTDEFHLTSQFVTEALQGHEFDRRGFYAVVLGLSYHPREKTKFRIPLR